MDVFNNIQVRPSYGTGVALISWNFNQNVPLGSVRVDRSLSGTGGWITLNGEKGEPNLTWYEDDAFGPDNPLDIVYYRLLFFSDKLPVIISNSVGIFEQYSRDEFCVTSEIIRREVLNLSLAAGLECLLYKKLHNGTRCNCVDSETGQAYGTGLCTTCYGTGLISGYERPWRTYVKLMTAKEYNKTDEPTKSIPISFMAKLPGYPEPKPEDVLVLLKTDDRYVLGANGKISLVRGNLPLIGNFPVIRLNRNDIRYKIPTPN